jgi:glycerol kinase
LATGFWETPAEIARLWATERTFVPGMARDQAQAKMQSWRRAVERTKDRP